MATPRSGVPDGGWGWVIVLASLMFHLLLGLVYSSQSVLYLALQQEFGHGKGVTSWILSVFSAGMVFVGPLSASMGVKYGYKAVTFAGGVLLGIGFFLSFFSPSIIFLILTIGVIAGVGSGLCYVPVIAMCALYFDKKRSLAVGLGTSGFGMGSFLFPPLVAYLEEEYTWRGVLLLICGCLLNMCVLALLMRPLKTAACPVVHDTPEENGILMMNGEIEMDIGDDDVTLNGFPLSDLTVVSVQQVDERDSGYGNENVLVKCENGSVGGDSTLSRTITATDIVPVPSPVEELQNSPSKSLLPHGNSNTTINGMAEIVKRKKYLLPVEAERSRSQSFNYRSSTSLDFIKTKANTRHHYQSAREISKSRNSDLDIVSGRQRKTSVQEMSKKVPVPVPSITNMSIMMMGSFYNVLAVDSYLNSMLSLNSKTTTMTGKEAESHNYVDEGICDVMETPPILEESSNHDHFISKTDKETTKTKTSSSTTRGFYEAFKDYIDLLTDCKFFLMIVINVLVSFTYLVPVLFIVDRAVGMGIPKEEAVLALSLYGAGNLCGRIMTGILADLRCTNRLVLYFICIFFCGLITSFSVFFGDCLPLHNAYGFFFGTLIGGYVILTPLVLVDMLGVEMVGKSYGLLIVFQGFAMLVGAPIAGWIRDITGSYEITFALFGSFMIFSALLIGPLRYLTIKGDNQEKGSQDEKLPLDSSP